LCQIRIKKEAAQLSEDEKLNRAGGDKYGKKTLMFKSSTKKEEAI